jgi:NAD(P)-dependent dehydrogenase (short-subunit alcohol dehydrogenase family)
VREVSCGFWQPPELDLEAELGDVGSEAFGFDVDRAAIEVVGTEVLVFGAVLQIPRPLSGQKALVTGANSGIGQFLRRGVGPEVSASAGKIICMSSVHQEIPWAGHCNYAASKGGIMMLMKSIAQEFAPHRIRINGIAPGAIRTPINTAAWKTEQAYDALMQLVPYGRIGEPDDIGRATVWLASDQADYVVGATLFVDGGMTLFAGFAIGG